MNRPFPKVDNTRYVHAYGDVAEMLSAYEPGLRCLKSPPRANLRYEFGRIADGGADAERVILDTSVLLSTRNVLRQGELLRAKLFRDGRKRYDAHLHASTLLMAATRYGNYAAALSDMMESNDNVFVTRPALYEMRSVHRRGGRGKAARVRGAGAVEEARNRVIDFVNGWNHYLISIDGSLGRIENAGRVLYTDHDGTDDLGLSEYMQLCRHLRRHRRKWGAKTPRNRNNFTDEDMVASMTRGLCADSDIVKLFRGMVRQAMDGDESLFGIVGEEKLKEKLFEDGGVSIFSLTHTNAEYGVSEINSTSYATERDKKRRHRQRRKERRR